MSQEIEIKHLEASESEGTCGGIGGGKEKTQNDCVCLLVYFILVPKSFILMPDYGLHYRNMQHQ